MLRSLALGGVALGGLLAMPPATAQDAPARPPVSAYPKPTDFPNANEAAVARHFNRARTIAGNDLEVFFGTLCVDVQSYRERINGVQYRGLVPAQKIFDNLFYVGQMGVSAWAIKGPNGIILIDALDNAGEARDIMVPGLVQMGLDPKDIKYVVLTHGHGDHYGGAQYFKDTYGAKVIASAADWDVMAKITSSNPRFDAPPRRGGDDLTVADGQTVNLAGAEIRFALTPGHTPGTLSMYFRVTDNGKAHKVGLYGGIGLPRTVENKQIAVKSMTHWMAMTKAAGVDAQIGNHPLHFDGPTRLEVLKYRQKGQPHPFVLGAANVQRYMDLQRECVLMSLARDGISQ
ncbi:MAG: MBL fold metallo-hydrolase [Pseudomonadota bacterium]